jgi:putative endonuclease
MFIVYILHSIVTNRYYVGSTHDVQLRLAHHNDGWSRSTKAGRPWRIVYTEQYPDRSGAVRREYEIKRRKSRKYIETLIAARANNE